MRKISKKALMAAAAVTGIFAGTAHAQQQWNVTEGTFNWHFDANWTPGPYPNAPGAVANVNNDIVGPMTIVIPGGDGITVGVLNLGDASTPPAPPNPPNPDQKFTLGTAPGGAGTFIFDNGANDAQLNVTKDINPATILTDFDQLGTNLQLNSNLVINANGPTTGSIVQIRGKISDGVNGPRGLTINGQWVELRQAGEANTFTGLTTVNSRLRLMSGGGLNLIAGDVDIRNGGVLQDGFGNGNVISDTSNINVVNGRYNPGGASDTIGSLEGGDNGSTGGGSGTVTFGGNNLDKTYNGIFFSETSWIKTGTGVQTLGGPLPSQVSDASPAAQHFSVLGGRVDLAKPAGVTSIGQRNLFIGDGSQVGALRPEVRLQASQQIQVHLSAGPTETTPVTLNSGILNLNGFSETVGSIVVAGSGTSTMRRANGLSIVNGLTVNETATLEIASDGSFNNVLKTPAVTIGATARIDLKDNKLLSDTPAGTFNGTNYTGIQGEVARAYSFGAWDLPGLTTSEDLADPTSGPLGGTTTIAVNKASEVLFIGDADTGVFSGQTVTGATTLAVYTYAGDVNLDGLVDAADYGVIDNWIQFPGTDGYMNGDFNYDGVIDAADYGIIDNTIQLQGAPIPMSGAVGASGAGMSGVTAVPEPASLSVIGLAAAAMLGRRRRHSH